MKKRWGTHNVKLGSVVVGAMEHALSHLGHPAFADGADEFMRAEFFAGLRLCGPPGHKSLRELISLMTLEPLNSRPWLRQETVRWTDSARTTRHSENGPDSGV